MQFIWPTERDLSHPVTHPNFGLIASRVILTHRNDTFKFLGDIWGATEEHSASSGVAKVDREWKLAQVALRDFDEDQAAVLDPDNRESLFVVLRVLRGIDDHVAGIITCLDAPRPLGVSIMSLARVLIEGSLLLCELLDPSVSPSTRLVRMLAQHLVMVEGRESLEESEPGVVTANMEVTDKIHAWYSTAAVECIPHKNSRRTASVRFPDAGLGRGYASAPTSMNATAAIQRHIPTSDDAYARLSGAVHSRGWMLESVYWGDNGNVDAPTASVQWVTMRYCLDAADAMASAVCTYVGGDRTMLAELLGKSHTRRLELITAAIGGDSPVSIERYLEG